MFVKTCSVTNKWTYLDYNTIRMVVTLSLSPLQSRGVYNVRQNLSLTWHLTCMTCITHRCFLSWWASPRSCSAPTGRNAPRTWYLLDYFLRSECLLGLWVTAELAWARAGLGSADPDINTEPGQAPGYQGETFPGSDICDISHNKPSVEGILMDSSPNHS